MLRNKYYRHMFFAMAGITIIGSTAAFSFHPLAGGCLLLTAILLSLVFLWGSRRRYADIKELSGYLRRIYSGDYSLDLRDNAEGELSILKNEIYKMTLILSRQADQLQTEKKQLADAISDISHQLKTPLTSMMVLTDVLSGELEQHERKEFTKSLNIQLERMEWLLTSLLKLSKIDAGTICFKKEPVRVETLVEKAMRPLWIPMELKEQRLILDDDAKATFQGDQNWTAEALINILKNCIEHTPEGGTITIRTEDNPIYTGIIITDTGKGIAKEDLPYIFKRFYKGRNAAEESVGIGLAMAHSIIHGQNGDIGVSSLCGPGIGHEQGTSFVIKFYKQII